MEARAEILILIQKGGYVVLEDHFDTPASCVSKKK